MRCVQCATASVLKHCQPIQSYVIFGLPPKRYFTFSSFWFVYIFQFTFPLSIFYNLLRELSADFA